MSKPKVVKLETPVPEPPETLSEAARDEWSRVAPILHARGTLTADRLTLLANFCDEAATVAHLSEVLKVEPLTVTGTDGLSKPHPLLRTKSKAVQSMTQIARKLGIIGPDAPSPKAPKGHDPYAELGIT